MSSRRDLCFFLVLLTLWLRGLLVHVFFGVGEGVCVGGGGGEAPLPCLCSCLEQPGMHVIS